MKQRGVLVFLAGAGVVILLAVELLGSLQVSYYAQGPTADTRSTLIERTISALVINGLTGTAREMNLELTGTASEIARNAIPGTVQARINAALTATAVIVSPTPLPTVNGIAASQTLQAAVDERSTAVARDQQSADLRSTGLALVYQTQTATAALVVPTLTPTISGVQLTQTIQAAVDERSTALAKDQQSADLRSTGLALVYQTQTATAARVVPTLTPTISGVQLTQTIQAAVDDRSTALAKDQRSADLRSTAYVFVYQTQTATAGAITLTPTPTISSVQLTQTIQAAVDDRSTALAKDQQAADLRSTAYVFAYQTQTAMAPTETPTPTATKGGK